MEKAAINANYFSGRLSKLRKDLRTAERQQYCPNRKSDQSTEN